MNSKKLAWDIRKDTLYMIYNSQGDHIGPILSVCDIIAVLYANILNYDPDNPDYDKRDRFILSKGHCGAAVYAALAHCGFFSRDILKTHRQDGTILSGHVSHNKVPGVEVSTGSLGHGLSIGAGMALAGKIDKKEYNVFVVLGDGECNEGSIWEAILFAANHKLDNLIAIVDRNNLQGMGKSELVSDLNPFADKWESFRWNVDSIDGHNHDELNDSIKSMLNKKNSKPSVIIANTIKGKGISFMENKTEWHYKAPNEEEYNLAINELERSRP